jgi:hypothetical protein
MFYSRRFESKLPRAPNIWHFRARIVVLAFAITGLTTPGIEAQAPTAPAQFEVATIKLNSGVSARSRTQPLPGGRLRVENQSLRALIRTAYQIQGFRISGGPGWIASDRYDILVVCLPPTRGSRGRNPPPHRQGVERRRAER